MAVKVKTDDDDTSRRLMVHDGCGAHISFVFKGRVLLWYENDKGEAEVYCDWCGRKIVFDELISPELCKLLYNRS